MSNLENIINYILIIIIIGLLIFGFSLLIPAADPLLAFSLIAVLIALGSFFKFILLVFKFIFGNKDQSTLKNFPSITFSDVLIPSFIGMTLIFILSILETSSFSFLFYFSLIYFIIYGSLFIIYYYYHFRQVGLFPNFFSNLKSWITNLFPVSRPNTSFFESYSRRDTILIILAIFCLGISILIFALLKFFEGGDDDDDDDGYTIMNETPQCK